MSAEQNARDASPTMRIGRRRSRSTQTPAGSAKRMNGMKPRTPRTRELERRRVELVEREERDRELGDLRAELADGLARPQLHEVAVSPEPSGRPTHRRPPRSRSRVVIDHGLPPGVSAARKSSMSFFARRSNRSHVLLRRAARGRGRSPLRTAPARPRSPRGGACSPRSSGRSPGSSAGRGRGAPCGRRTSPSSRAPCACARRGSGRRVSSTLRWWPTVPFGRPSSSGELLRRPRRSRMQLDRVGRGTGSAIAFSCVGSETIIVSARVVVVSVNGRHFPNIRQIPTIRKSTYRSRP